MFSLTVRDHIMIAHSFRGDIFGPAQRLHGATYTVELELRRPDLDRHGVVADVGTLRKLLRDTLAALDYRNLDDEPSFGGRNTTTEVLAHELHARIARRIKEGALGDSKPPVALKVTLRESPVAWAAYESPI
jgi:6-pyruvoyl-tetrahydropterin synthase